MPGRPLIAISGRPRAPGEVSGWTGVASTVAQMTYIEAVVRAGAEPVVIPPRPLTDEAAAALLARFDGVILVGGGDVDPDNYEQQRAPEVYGVEAASDGLELALARAALATRTPLLAICRGLQVLNVALGGTLHQHMADHSTINHGRANLGHGRHGVEVEPGSRLAKAIGGASEVNAAWSFHHQSIDSLAPGLVVTGRSEDGIIEAVEPLSSAGWCVAVQWHPERTAHDDPQQQALFAALVGATTNSPR